MNRTRWLALGGVALVAVFAWWWVSSHRGAEKPRYRTAALEKGNIEMVVSATGTIRPVEQVDVGSQVSGTVQRITADFNSRVTKGQLLLQLDPSSFRARFQQAEAAVARAQAALRDARRGYARAQELMKENYISQADVETAEVTVDQREADLKQARAQLESARVDLDNSTIRSPIDGVVIARSIEVGQTVAASLQAPKLFVIANDLTRMQVETRIDEADIGQIRPGLPVIFTVDAFPDQTFEGTVSQVRLEPITEQNVVTYTTVIGTRNPDLRLRPGMTANVSVQVADRSDVLKVPNAALRFRPPADAAVSGRAVASAQSRNGGAAGANRGGRDTSSAAKAAAGGAAQRGDKGATGGKAAANEPVDDFGRAESERRMRERGMPEAMIKGMLERRDQLVADMKAQGKSNDEIRAELERLRSTMRGGGGGQGSSSFRNFGRGGASNTRSAARVPQTGPVVMGTTGTPQPKPATVYVLRDGKPAPVSVTVGISDGGFTEVIGGELKPGDQVIVGTETTGNRAASANVQLPPGMGGGGGGRGGGGGGGRTGR